MQLNEVVDLFVAIAVLPIVVAIWRRSKALQAAPALLVGYLLVLTAYVLTIVEGVGGIAGEILNAAEHTALLGAGIAFVLGVRSLGRETQGAKR